MKRCPTCNKTFSDLNLIYCVDDGTPLVATAEDDEQTQFAGGGSGRNPPQYQPPSYVVPEETKKRRTWPWVVGVLSLLVLVVVGFTVAAFVLVPRMLKRAEPIVISNRNANSAENSNSSLNRNSNSETETPANTNSNSESTPAPTDKELVLAQLRDLENEWTVANVNADKKKLSQILADDYVGPSATGQMQGKAEYINTVERDTSIQKWEFEDLRITLRGDRATLLGKVRFQLRDREVVYDFVDRFVWRDSRWQATGSEVTLDQQSPSS